MTSDERLREYLKRVTIDLHDARMRLREIEARAREPIAIVGIGCRYPGACVLAAGPVGAGPLRRRCDRGVPAGSRLGSGGAGRRRPRSSRCRRRTRGRVRARRHRVRRGVLRNQPEGGTGDGSPAATPARSELGGARRRGDRPALAARQPDGGVRRGKSRALRRAHVTDLGRLSGDRRCPERGVGTGGVRARTRGPRGLGGHGVLLLAGGAAPGVRRTARRTSVRWRWRGVSR